MHKLNTSMKNVWLDIPSAAFKLKKKTTYNCNYQCVNCFIIKKGYEQKSISPVLSESVCYFIIAHLRWVNASYVRINLPFKQTDKLCRIHINEMKRERERKSGMKTYSGWVQFPWGRVRVWWSFHVNRMLHNHKFSFYQFLVVGVNRATLCIYLFHFFSMRNIP